MILEEEFPFGPDPEEIFVATLSAICEEGRRRGAHVSRDGKPGPTYVDWHGVPRMVYAWIGLKEPSTGREYLTHVNALDIMSAGTSPEEVSAAMWKEAERAWDAMRIAAGEAAR